jgi:hypothetical protein
MKDFTWDINGTTLEYFDDEHIYLVDGIQVPSITEILKVRFGNKYSGVSKDVLQKAADAGTAVHEAIEAYCQRGEDSPLQEVRNFKFLQSRYNFDILNNELPVILYDDDRPIAAGRLDLLLTIDNKLGIADIKRTSVLDKDYLFYQLNLYRIALQQNSALEVEFLRGIHLRDDKRKFVEIPINEESAWELVHQFQKGESK